MGDHVEIDVPARAEFLAVVREVVSIVAESSAKLPLHRIDDLRLAVTEALANAIDAEWRKPKHRRLPVVVRCDLEPGRIAVEVHDEAGGFDPNAVPSHPEVTKPARLKYERGLGIPLMRELADAVEFVPEGDGTTVRLVVEAERRRR
jgi:anti-sigma regulatory factor (Ser/Thr protein kinase)